MYFKGHLDFDRNQRNKKLMDKIKTVISQQMKAFSASFPRDEIAVHLVWLFPLTDAPINTYREQFNSYIACSTNCSEKSFKEIRV